MRRHGLPSLSTPWPKQRVIEGRCFSVRSGKPTSTNWDTTSVGAKNRLRMLAWRSAVAARNLGSVWYARQWDSLEWREDKPHLGVLLRTVSVRRGAHFAARFCKELIVFRATFSSARFAAVGAQWD